jgi:hypothetical protein
VYSREQFSARRIPVPYRECVNEQIVKGSPVPEVIAMRTSCEERLRAEPVPSHATSFGISKHFKCLEINNGR